MLEIENPLLIIEEYARENGIPMAEVCLGAPIAVSSWTRWKSGKVSPGWDNIVKIVDSLNAAIARRKKNKS